MRPVSTSIVDTTRKKISTVNAISACDEALISGIFFLLAINYHLFFIAL
jgi:hypothetical protein